MSIAQASVSEQIRRLEDEYGVSLFKRRARQLVRPSTGSELLPFADQAIAAVDGRSRALRSLRSLGGGVATFGLIRNADRQRRRRQFPVPQNVSTVAFEEPLWDTIALVQKEGTVLSPATREIARLAQEMLLDRADEPHFVQRAPAHTT